MKKNKGREGVLINFLPLKRGGLFEGGGLFERGGLIEDLWEFNKGGLLDQVTSILAVFLGV